MAADEENGVAERLKAVADVLEGYAKRNEIDLIVISSHGRRGIARLSLGSVTDSLIRDTTIPVLVVKPRASYLKPEASKEFRHIVVPLDGSTLAEQILTRVVPLAKLEEAEITLLHVLAPDKDDYRSEENAELPWWEKRVSGAKTYLSRRAGEIRRQGVPASFDVIVGEHVPEAIADFARREGAELIAIATQGRDASVAWTGFDGVNSRVVSAGAQCGTSSTGIRMPRGGTQSGADEGRNRSAQGGDEGGADAPAARKRGVTGTDTNTNARHQAMA